MHLFSESHNHKSGGKVVFNRQGALIWINVVDVEDGVEGIVCSL